MYESAVFFFPLWDNLTYHMLYIQFSNILAGSKTLDTGFIVLEHDLFGVTVEIATGYILPEGLASNLTIMPIIECLHLDLSNAYIETNDNETNPLPTAVGTMTLQKVSPTSTPGSGQSGSSSGDPQGSGSNGAVVTSVRLYTTAVASVVISAALLLLK